MAEEDTEIPQEMSHHQNQDTDNISEAQEGWVYLGHGEWGQMEIEEGTVRHGNVLAQHPEWITQWLSKNDSDLSWHNEVKKKGYPNRWGAKIPVQSKWNIELFQALLQGYEDQDVME